MCQQKGFSLTEWLFMIVVTGVLIAILSLTIW